MTMSSPMPNQPYGIFQHSGFFFSFSFYLFLFFFRSSTKKEKIFLTKNTMCVCVCRTLAKKKLCFVRRMNCHLVAKCEKNDMVFIRHTMKSSLNRSSHALGVKCDSLGLYTCMLICQHYRSSETREKKNHNHPTNNWRLKESREKYECGMQP